MHLIRERAQNSSEIDRRKGKNPSAFDRRKSTKPQCLVNILYNRLSRGADMDDDSTVYSDQGVAPASSPFGGGKLT